LWVGQCEAENSLVSRAAASPERTTRPLQASDRTLVLSLSRLIERGLRRAAILALISCSAARNAGVGVVLIAFESAEYSPGRATD